MKNKILTAGAALLLLAYSCKQKDQTSEATLSPEAGTTYKQGDKVTVKLSNVADGKADSVVYQLDSVKIETKKDLSAISIATDTMPLGPRVVTAKVYQGGQVQEVSTNFNLLAAKAPEELTYQVEKVFPHDTSSYTEGLLYQDDYLYESDGGRLSEGEGRSSLRKTDLATGKVVQKADVAPEVFAEGISIVGNKIIQLTYTEKIGYVYDKNTFKLLNTFTNNVGAEGWGMCFDGKRLYMDDSTNRLWFLDKDTYRATGYVDVYDDKGPINQINELEYIDGKIYANIYQSDAIVVINPKTGAVMQRIDLSKLYPQSEREQSPGADVLNGIAWDAAGKRLFITGKKWPHLYQVKFTNK
ncbi:glutaminyl-peptide cyclotransferase [Mucilaginibacter robiniae]|uniref:Glutaminyl-peptide cyclotransferase n=1 Tax=Mucilaginibacter robiniae TaxID=2728022 RepID=A0A7L5E4L1_9SPHI|nr:glutaminyl-peptide cyclotransferase [Mucilaginibacter robiniae]QJD95763.1 glutaminyl-peptide cyclotransferase [Mucilaginibacter robiniae]